MKSVTNNIPHNFQKSVEKGLVWLIRNKRHMIKKYYLITYESIKTFLPNSA